MNVPVLTLETEDLGVSFETAGSGMMGDATADALLVATFGGAFLDLFLFDTAVAGNA